MLNLLHFFSHHAVPLTVVRTKKSGLITSREFSGKIKNGKNKNNQGMRGNHEQIFFFKIFSILFHWTKEAGGRISLQKPQQTLISSVRLDLNNRQNLLTFKQIFTPDVQKGNWFLFLVPVLTAYGAQRGTSEIRSASELYSSKFTKAIELTE